MAIAFLMCEQTPRPFHQTSLFSVPRVRFFVLARSRNHTGSFTNEKHPSDHVGGLDQRRVSLSLVRLLNGVHSVDSNDQSFSSSITRTEISIFGVRDTVIRKRFPPIEMMSSKMLERGGVTRMSKLKCKVADAVGVSFKRIHLTHTP